MCFGPFTRICHWGPITALVIIKCVTGMALHCSSMWWPSTTWGGFLNTFCFMSLSGLTLYNFLSCMYHGPGYLPLGWKPKDEKDCDKVQFCNVCKGYKAPRSHHCRKCGRCVLKMDHHCPWINNCVGWGNHAHFVAFLSFAVLGCTHGSVILFNSLYRALFFKYFMETGQYPLIRFGLYGFIFCVFSLGLSIGVVIAVGMLLYFQVKAVVNNRTSIEDWILEKAKHRRRVTGETYQFPYDLGFWGNIRQVARCNCEPVGDGVTWKVAKDCDQYTLTVEQLSQKCEKRERTKVYKICRPASGSWVPITQGFGVCLHHPCTDEPRIKLDKDDYVIVTRWRKYWLFGEKMQETENSASRIRGWFPRRCAVELNNETFINQRHEQNKKIK